MDIDVLQIIPAELREDLKNHLKQTHPYLSDDSLTWMTRLIIGIGMFADSESEVGELTQTLLIKQSEKGNAWAKKILEEISADMLRAYDMATKAGSDPVEHIRVSYGISLKQAQESVAKIRASR